MDTKEHAHARESGATHCQRYPGPLCCLLSAEAAALTAVET